MYLFIYIYIVYNNNNYHYSEFIIINSVSLYTTIL